MDLYHKYHVSRSDERLGLLQLLKSEFGPESALYPGCFVHVTPSLLLRELSQVDSGRKAARFLRDGSVAPIIVDRKSCQQEAGFRFLHRDYAEGPDLALHSVELPIST